MQYHKILILKKTLEGLHLVNFNTNLTDSLLSRYSFYHLFRILLPEQLLLLQHTNALIL